MSIHIGTSGWFYDHWKEIFYPEGLAKPEWLVYYSCSFSTVEINNTFYRLPTENAVKKWTEDTSKKFLFSVKASRYITHIKRLADCEEAVKHLFHLLTPMKSKLGPILFQFPPSFKNTEETLNRVKHFLQLLPKGFLYTFEFRHPSWFNEEIYKLLKKFKVALCITDLNGKLSPVEVTASFVYIRLHGPKKAYKGSYSPQQLTLWKKRLLQWKKERIDSYCYFDNDEKAFAIQDAIRLIDAIE